MMTHQADFKARVRARMERTGENYTTARAGMLADPPPTRTPDPNAEKAIRSFFDGDRLRSIPTKRRARAAVLMHLLARFERGRTYAESEVNGILRTAHADFSTLRRELVDYRWLNRVGGTYRVADVAPPRTGNEAQEVPTDEADRLERLLRAGGQE